MGCKKRNASRLSHIRPLIGDICIHIKFTFIQNSLHAWLMNIMRGEREGGGGEREMREIISERLKKTLVLITDFYTAGFINQMALLLLLMFIDISAAFSF